MLNIEMAGIAICLDNKYPYIESIAAPYLTDKKADFTVSAEREEIEREMKKLSVSAPYAESVVLYSKIAEKLHLYDAFIIHAVAIELDSEVYLVAARSGVGKTTHARLWLDTFGTRARIINGDKPIIRKIDGELYAAGTLWCGKEHLGEPKISKIKAIALLERSEENRAENISKSDAVAPLAAQLYMPKSPVAIASALSLFDELISNKRIVKIGANMDKSAALTAYSAMTEK